MGAEVSVEERRERLLALAHILNARGWSSQVVTPSDVPLLRVIDPQAVALSPGHIVCEGARGHADWYQWRHKGDRIAPADQPESAARQIMRALNPRGKT